ncbi:LysR substrate-binding domain-containing protein [Snodgrassella alvi]|uniref:LysR substrate-binding domain-containing protein n=1 Tax=Snodgrassella alvi TaxID=1196083 RepID=UPI000C1EDAA7|nr:LysR substrate-binding domain-containing protein [Snodgrassella alvi]
MAISNVNHHSAERIIIGITKILGFNFVPLFNEFISRFQQHINLLQQDYSSKELLAEFNKSNIDLVIISDYKHNSHQANSLLAYQEIMLLALVEYHPACAQEKVDLNTVVDLPLYWCKPYQNPALYDRLQKIISQLPTPLTLQQKLPNFLTMLMVIAMGRGMLLLPASIAQAQMQGVVYKRPTAKYVRQLSMNMHLLWHKSAAENTIINEMIGYFKLHNTASVSV